MDFLKIETRPTKKNGIEIFPNFIVRKSKDLMIRGGDFYAIWDEEQGLWSTDEEDAAGLIDSELSKFKNANPDLAKAHVLYLHDSKSKMIDAWHHYVQKQMRDNYHSLDDKLVFSDSPIDKKDYASKRLPYSLSDCDIPAWNELLSVLYSEPERHKIEWAIGSIVNGDSKKLQKFVVFYGSAGTGKSTILNIVQMLFEGYCSSFNSKALGSANATFALEPFKNNPLIAIEHDGDLSRIEDNTRLNSIVSHEPMTVDLKFKSQYTDVFKSMLFVGTNRPVRITDSKSGIIRRLIDVSPTGTKIPAKRYRQLLSQIPFELGGIASHCRDVYEQDKYYYENYIPINMIGATNDMYNFMDEQYDQYVQMECISLGKAWNDYKKYCEESKVSYPMPKRLFKEELKSYYKEFKDRGMVDGKQEYNVYYDLNKERFEKGDPINGNTIIGGSWIRLKPQKSLLDIECSDFPAQYADENEHPLKSWDKCKTTLKDINTNELHYVLFPDGYKNHIVIDFDIKGDDGEKSFEKNIEAATKFPKTYAELSKGGKGLHLHYIYDGDVSKLSAVYDDNIEVKVFNGKSSLRRRLTTCNDIQIAHINSGLPLKEKKKVVNQDIIKTEKQLRSRIEKCLRKEHHGATAPEVDFIKKILDDAYESGMSYDLSDMKQVVLIFANNSTHQAKRCIKVVDQMHFQSEDNEVVINTDGKYLSDKLVFFDVETFKNFFGICWKFDGDKQVNKMFNPSPAEVAHLTNYKLVGFNNRKYDNHILYARMQGFNNAELYDISRRIIDKKDQSAFFREAYNLSYTDILDFASAANKKGLKKWEIELGIHHQELGLKWDEPVPEELWPTVMDYCANDVIATEAVFHHLSADFEAREILAELTGLSINATTNQHTINLIVGNDKNPQSQFIYTDLSDMFPGYEFDGHTSTYKGEVTGEGGYVYAEPGIYHDVALLDIASMHPSSALALNIFGPYTKNFEDLVKTRLYIKHGDYDKAATLFDGKLKPFLDDKEQAEALAGALKTAINSVYGLTAAHFDNKLKDPRNVDNIVAKRGALFMIDLKEEVQKRGYTVAHIKTDSIKIPNADLKIIKFVTDFGKKYGYTFEHEATYDRMCLVNDAVYIAKYGTVEYCEKLYGSEYINSEPDICKKNKKKPNTWDATGTQFAVPYVFKTLFSKEKIKFEDKCETKSVKSAMYLDMDEDLEEDQHNYVFIGRTGLFCPIKTGCGGGRLLREQGDKYYSVTGTKDYRWLEAETVNNLKKQKDIDDSYYKKLVDEAIKAISKYGDANNFINE